MRKEKLDEFGQIIKIVTKRRRGKKNAEEARAAEKVGIEMIGTGSPGKYKNPDNHQNFNELIKIREAAPSAFMHYGASDTLYTDSYEACKLAFNAILNRYADRGAAPIGLGLLEHGFRQTHAGQRQAPHQSGLQVGVYLPPPR